MATNVIDWRRPHVLRTAREYKAAVSEVDRLLEANPRKGTAEYDRLELLSVLIEAYEDAHEPEPEPPTPQAAVAFMLEQKGLTRSDLAAHLGGRSRVSEFFAGKRPLSVSQIRALRDLLGIPADLLID